MVLFKSLSSLSFRPTRSPWKHFMYLHGHKQWKWSRDVHLEPRTRHLPGDYFSAAVSLKGNFLGSDCKINKTLWWLTLLLKNVLLLVSTIKRNLVFACFRVMTVTGNRTSDKFSVSSKGTDSPSASFSVSSSVQLISVWVQVQNQLGSAESVTINYTLSDIGKAAAVIVWQAFEMLGNLSIESTLHFVWFPLVCEAWSHNVSMTGTWNQPCRKKCPLKL